MSRITNTAPLIFLAKLERLELLRQAALGSWLIEKPCTHRSRLEIIKQSMDAGEAEVIALALELGIDDVVLDDLDARRFARRSGLRPIGTLGLLLAGKENGVIESISDEITRLRSLGFRASEVLIATILASANE